METFIIEATKQTPFIKLEPSGVIEISGSSTNSNILNFYQPILQWLEEYMKAPADLTTVNCKLIYYNTITCKVLMHIFKTLEKLPAPQSVEIIWHYDTEDEDMREYGEDFKAVLKNIDFKFHEIN